MLSLACRTRRERLLLQYDERVQARCARDVLKFRNIPSRSDFSNEHQHEGSELQKFSKNISRALLGTKQGDKDVFR